MIAKLKEKVKEFLKKNCDVIAHNVIEMKEISLEMSPKVMLHRLNVRREAKPIKKKRRSI